MNKKIVVFITSATVVATCSEFLIIRNKQKEDNRDNVFLKVNDKYDVTKEMQQSLSNIDRNKRSDIIKDINTSKGVVALSFENIEDMDTLQKILDMLQEYSVKATFIISGKQAAENAEMIQAINKHGHEIGTTAFTETDSTNMSEEEIIRNLCKAKKVVESITNNEVNIIKCKTENYTNDFLSDTYACGFKYTVESHKYINYQSFKNYEEAYGYINRIKNGSVISVKVNGVLDESEYTGSRKQENHLSFDKQPELEEVSYNSYKKKQITILDTIEWLLQSISLNNKRNVILSKLPEFNGVYEDQKQYETQYVNNYLADHSIDNLAVKTEMNYKPKVQKEENGETELYVQDFSNIINKNNGKLASEIKNFYTTQKSVSYTFKGISDEESLNNVLETLKKTNIRSTFFVSKDEIEKYPDRIKKIVSYGNEIGNGGITNNSKILDKSVQDICNEIYTVNEMLGKMGIKTTSYMPGYGYVNNNIKEAVSSMNNMSGYEDYRLLTYTKAPIISRYKNSTAENIMKDYLNTNTYLSLQKGEIVYFRLDSGLFNDKSTVAHLVSDITENYVHNGYIHRYNSANNSYELTQKPLGYSVVPVSELNNSYEINITTDSAVNIVTTNAGVDFATTNEAVNISIENTETKNIQDQSNYSVIQEALTINNQQNKKYNENVQSKTTEVKVTNHNSISGNTVKILKDRSNAAAQAMYSSNYIGNNYVELTGFTKEMADKMDKTGLIDTNNESVIFFTFDDWGSDVILNEILDVLNKHNVNGTFFTISKYIDVNSGISNANPNLLRTIALNGNDIGSHTYNHDTSDIEKEKFKESVKKSYYALDSVVGDTGALKSIIRFPQLLTTKDGLDACFESGFDYCVSGNISTHDYEAGSAQEIIDNIVSQLVPNKGNIIVMHMNNQAYYTAEALDIFLTNNENGVYGKKYKIVKLGDYLK